MAAETIKAHEFSSMFPLMEGAEFDELVADIKEHGQHEFIVLLNDRILDGRNRYRACLKLGITPKMRDLQCVDGNPLDYVWSANVKRRHLSPGAIALASAARATFKSGELGRGRQVVPGALPNENGSLPPILIREAAALAECSQDTIKRAKTILEYGTPKEKQAVLAGKLKIKTAANLAKERKPKEEALDVKLTREAGRPIVIPAGHTFESHVRHGLKLEETEGLTVENTAKKLSMSEHSYRRLREIVLIHDRKDLTQKDRQLANEAMKALTETGQTLGHALIEPISKRIWGETAPGKERNEATELHRLGEFERKVDIIYHVCTTDIELPQLNRERVDHSIVVLEQSCNSIRGLIRKMKEVYNG